MTHPVLMYMGADHAFQQDILTDMLFAVGGRESSDWRSWGSKILNYIQVHLWHSEQYELLSEGDYFFPFRQPLVKCVRLIPITFWASTWEAFKQPMSCVHGCILAPIIQLQSAGWSSLGVHY